MQRKIPTTFTIGLDLLERLTKVAADERVTKSFIVRNAIERELRRYQRTHVAAAAKAARNGRSRFGRPT
jgi:predicted transcriptional regulator